ncbi:MAG: transglutaminase domain-containing protein [Dysgonamonadaceae bacterium]
MKIRYICIACLFLSKTVEPLEAQLIRNKQRLTDIALKLETQKKLTSKGNSEIWDYLEKTMPTDEEQALKFLYAYMPLSDLADYSPDFMKMNVKYALQAKEEMLWGKKIPEDIFLHFVLPVRVNNENLDIFRQVMYPELKERVKGLSMKEAVLEINHWCHEKVSYRGTDIRTSAPLSTVKKSFGRCGEESTFTVTALRTVGIPARQVYTPRWAHSDDNHAWVEVWADGDWYYLGACEPDPALNMGWFSEPATRVMLVHTRTYGKYMDEESVITAESRFSELNLTAHYAPVKQACIFVKDRNGNPVDGAKIEFGLYNYAEYYPVYTTFSQNGAASFNTGYGDLLIWASKDGMFGYAKLDADKNSLTLHLQHTSLNGMSNSYLMTPPHIGKYSLNASPEQIKQNSLRLLKEDSIRNNYISTFKDSVWAENLANELHLNPIQTKYIISKNYGNWSEMEQFLRKGSRISPKYVLALLEQASEKDLSDASASILLKQLQAAMNASKRMDAGDKKLFEQYILAPRMSNERLSDWGKFLNSVFDQSFQRKTRENINYLKEWILENITIDNTANLHSRAPITPEGVYKLRVSDSKSRDIFFVAACRAFGIPARINRATLEPEYSKSGNWNVLYFSKQPTIQPQKGKIHLKNADNPVEPQYFSHFTIGKLQDGSYKTLEFDEGKKISEFPEYLDLESGYYRVVTGNRQSDGSVLSSISYFKVSPDSVSEVKIELMKQAQELRPSAKLILSQMRVEPISANSTKTIAELSSEKYTVLVIIDPDKEPSKHIMNDLASYRRSLSETTTQFIFVTTEKNASGLEILKTYSLPDNYIAGTDKNENILETVANKYGQKTKEQLPLALLFDQQGNVFYFSSGYKIGIGEQLLRVIRQAEKQNSSNDKTKTCSSN